MNEAISTSADVLVQLDAQKSQIIRARSNVERIQDGITSAFKKTRDIARNISLEKVVVGAIIAVLVITMGILFLILLLLTFYICIIFHFFGKHKYLLFLFFLFLFKYKLNNKIISLFFFYSFLFETIELFSTHYLDKVRTSFQSVSESHTRAKCSRFFNFS